MRRWVCAGAAGSLCALLVACGGGGSSGPAVVTLSTNAVSFQETDGIVSPQATIVTISISGNADHEVSASSDSSWIRADLEPQGVQIVIFSQSFAPGTYTGHVNVNVTDVQNSPDTITVTFTVNSTVANNPTWQQWGANAAHTGMVSVAGQGLTTQLARIAYDPFVSQEQAASGGELVVHYQAPITDGPDVYMMMKMGTYSGPNLWNTEEWCEVRYSWVNGTLTQIWDFQSDWKPEPNGADLQGWEPVFHPVDANGYIYAPGAGGTIWKVNKTSGMWASHINPFSGIPGFDATDTYVSGPLTADAQGNIYYNAIELAPAAQGDWAYNDIQGAWLVKVDPTDTASMVSYATLVPNAPAAGSTSCPGTFYNLNDNGASLPWPPSPTATPLPELCGSQRPGINIAPAVGADGTIYTASMAHFDGMVAYLVAVNPDLTPKWAASLQNLLNDGCGVLVPIATNTSTPNSCRPGTTPGVDPTTNAPGSGVIIDEASSSPAVLPDGTVLFGALDNYDASRGHMFHFDAQGNFINTYDFGWDTTPAVYSHNGTFSIVLKDNHYDAPLYCYFNNPLCAPLPPGPYYITQLDSNLSVQWQFQNATTDANHPNGYEWCINMPAVDINGNVYVNSEDGNIYELAQSNPGSPAGKIFLNLAIGAAYTPLSIGADGKLYTQNDGILFVVGN